MILDSTSTFCLISSQPSYSHSPRIRSPGVEKNLPASQQASIDRYHVRYSEGGSKYMLMICDGVSRSTFRSLERSEVVLLSLI